MVEELEKPIEETLKEAKPQFDSTALVAELTNYSKEALDTRLSGNIRFGVAGAYDAPPDEREKLEREAIEFAKEKVLSLKPGIVSLAHTISELEPESRQKYNNLLEALKLALKGLDDWLKLPDDEKRGHRDRFVSSDKVGADAVIDSAIMIITEESTRVWTEIDRLAL